MSVGDLLADVMLTYGGGVLIRSSGPERAPRVTFKNFNILVMVE
jgi:hypothetical protein